MGKRICGGLYQGFLRYLIFLLFYSALTNASEGLPRNKAIKFEVEVLHTLNFHRICLI